MEAVIAILSLVSFQLSEIGLAGAEEDTRNFILDELLPGIFGDEQLDDAQEMTPIADLW